MIYQDLWLEGKCVVRGVRECEKRYLAIRSFIQKFKRPITVLDIGANLGYFSLRLSEEFPGTYVMIEGSSKYLEILYAASSKNNRAMILPFYLTHKKLKMLADVEHFDVVLALSILHHFREPYGEVFKTLTKLGSYLFFEHPNPKEECMNHARVVNETINISDYTSKIYASCPAAGYSDDILRDTHLIECGVQSPSIPFWQQCRRGSVLYSDFHKKFAEFPMLKRRENWPNGISLFTFLTLGGIFPSRKTLAKMIEALDLTKVSSLNLQNIILSEGKLIVLPSNESKSKNIEKDRRNLIQLIL